MILGQVVLLGRPGRKRKFKRTASGRAVPPPRDRFDRGTPEQRLKRQALLGGAGDEQQQSYLGDPLGLMKLKGLINGEQEQAGKSFSQMYARVFGTLTVSTAEPIGRRRTWDEMTLEAQEHAVADEENLKRILSGFTNLERKVIYDYVLTDKLPEWLVIPYKDLDKTRQIKEFQVFDSALSFLARYYGLYSGLKKTPVGSVK